ncbi:hypothetical protein BpJC7_20390 [Weizmannia acidilactici]|uniref:Cell wall elongation regulator TseB-like domain-containing protein n=1 Tax=Weizmannia acidilactici TaxID=2607726 RepID=A0A5J4J735_9BACI|nr:DUF5590 domain-containing protein [Weizmannia acidilactici]GER67898.1 hypothetical protein BpJC4_23690 [Weizmannia acidilactici]GER70736.1 hypothetical protein BpJC7_20390 [Weizmannia acidilactici]GER73741.1 hypothetical protein BpPP18_18080 [Weizmannia acidilactici]
MKKALIIIGIFIAVIVGFAAQTYWGARKPYNDAYKKAQSLAKTEAGIRSVDQFYLYNGNATYYVVVGKGKGGAKKAVWIPEKHPKRIVVLNWNSGISKQDAVNQVRQNKQPDKILSVRLGMDSQVPIWEVAYIKGNNLSYYEVPFLKKSH